MIPTKGHGTSAKGPVYHSTTGKKVVKVPTPLATAKSNSMPGY